MLHAWVETALNWFKKILRQSFWKKNIFNSGTPTKLFVGRLRQFLAYFPHAFVRFEDLYWKSRRRRSRACSRCLKAYLMVGTDNLTFCLSWVTVAFRINRPLNNSWGSRRLMRQNETSSLSDVAENSFALRDGSNDLVLEAASLYCRASTGWLSGHKNWARFPLAIKVLSVGHTYLVSAKEVSILGHLFRGQIVIRLPLRPHTTAHKRRKCINKKILPPGRHHTPVHKVSNLSRVHWIVEDPWCLYLW